MGPTNCYKQGSAGVQTKAKDSWQGQKHCDSPGHIVSIINNANIVNNINIVISKSYWWSAEGLSLQGVTASQEAVWSTTQARPLCFVVEPHKLACAFLAHFTGRHTPKWHLIVIYALQGMAPFQHQPVKFFYLCSAFASLYVQSCAALLLLLLS